MVAKRLELIRLVRLLLSLIWHARPACSCYANSLLQALLATPPLAAYLVSGEHGRGCLKASASDWCVLCELESLAQGAYSGDGSASILNPRPLVCCVWPAGGWAAS